MIAFLLALWACGGDEPAPPPELPTPPPSLTPDAVSDASASKPAAPAPPDHPVVSPNRLAASHVLVAYAGAVGALPNVTRTKDEARARAEEARRKILDGEDFAAIAKAYSDDSSGPRGGSLGSFGPGTMVEPFEKAVAALPVGGVSELVETPFGYHVIRRDVVMEVHEKHLMISWAGAERAPTGVTRSKAEAQARMEEVVAKLAGGEAWDDLVRRYSDGPLKEDGGDLGWFGRGQLAPALDKAAFSLDIGKVSDVIESPRGFHLLERVE